MATLMAIDLVSLRKLMQLMLSAENRRTAMLRSDITEGLRKERNGPNDGGGDFHSPFWADAKAHAEGISDLRDTTPQRVEANGRRRRLYPRLTEGFLAWWEDRRRRRNEPFKIIESHLRGRVELRGLGVVKVENNLAFTIGDDGERVIYPYFCEEPEMTSEMARLGLWAVSQAINDYSIEDVRILDVIRGRSFSVLECSQRGSEEEEFRMHYGTLLSRWAELRREYD